jgi:hypothetical protein
MREAARGDPPGSRIRTDRGPISRPGRGGRRKSLLSQVENGEIEPYYKDVKYLTLSIALLATTAVAGPKVKPSVEFARSWDAAVAEAKMLNVPIVVHNHGFY